MMTKRYLAHISANRESDLNLLGRSEVEVGQDTDGEQKSVCLTASHLLLLWIKL
jgi:hypothetical protein